MAANRGFIEIERAEREHDAPQERVRHWHEFTHPLAEDVARTQARRCMECGTPFCSNACPLHNLAPEFNRLAREGAWREAWDVLASTNNFPEFTSRICPALCEAACAIGFIRDASMAVQAIENAIVTRALAEGWVVPLLPDARTGKSVAVIGSGPAGLACAQQLARAGHDVTVYEKNDRPGGLLRYGIPDFKLDKALLDRRIEQMQAEGVTFVLSTAVGSDDFAPGILSQAKTVVPAREILAKYDAVVLAAGSEEPRNLPVPGRDLKGVHFALELLQACNKSVASGSQACPIDVKGQDAIVIGGGDTGADVVGTLHRLGAANVIQVEINAKPPEKEDKLAVWPEWPIKLRTSAYHEEGCDRRWSFGTKEFLGDKKGCLRAVRAVRMETRLDPVTGRRQFCEVPGSEVEVPATKAFLAMGFVHPSQSLLAAFGVEADKRGNAMAPWDGKAAYATSVPKVFAAGDAHRGQSLVVRAIAEGRAAARAVDMFLTGASCLNG